MFQSHKADYQLKSSEGKTWFGLFQSHKADYQRGFELVVWLDGRSFNPIRQITNLSWWLEMLEEEEFQSHKADYQRGFELVVWLDGRSFNPIRQITNIVRHLGNTISGVFQSHKADYQPVNPLSIIKL